MPWLLYRYILSDLLRITALATAVLVTVIAFGAAVKPLAGGLLAPSDLPKYVALAVVPMLQFALPFAAGFAATMTFHRLVSDNEILAMAVSGISYRRILLPVFALGVALTVAMFVLVQYIIPTFWVLMQKTLERDITRMFQTAVDRGEAFMLGENIQIFAEEMQIDSNPDPLIAPGVMRRLWLGKVAAVEVGEDGGITRDYTARAAVVDFIEEDDRTILHISMRDAVVFDASGQQGEDGTWRTQLIRLPEVDTPEPLVLPDAFKDRLKFMSLSMLLYLRHNPGEFRSVIREKQRLIEALRTAESWMEIERSVNEQGLVVFEQVDSPEVYRIAADRLRARTLTRAGAGRVEVEIVRAGVVERRIACENALIEQPRTGRDLAAAGSGAVQYSITLHHCEVLDPETGELLYRQSEYPLLDLRLATEPELIPEDEPVDRLIERAVARAGDRPVAVAADRVLSEIFDMQCEITSRIHQRSALAVTVLLLLSLGSVLAIRLRETMPLIIYLIAFLPSIADLLLISGGAHTMRSQHLIVGFAVLWSGNLALLLITMAAYFRIARN